MEILVTGGTGFTGGSLVRYLLGKGHHVTVLDKASGLFDQELKELGAKIYYGDILDEKLVNDLVKGKKVVFHVAAAFRGVDLPKKVYWNVNVNGTEVIAKASLNKGVKRFIYCSTEGVHGHIPHPPADETAPIAPKDYYQYSKYKGEEVVQKYIQRGLNAVILRPTAIYGPGDPGRYLLLFKWAKKGIFPIFGSGGVTYHPLYIENLNQAFELAMEKDNAVGETYLIADEKYYTLEEIVEEVGRAIRVDVKIIHLPFTPLLVASYLCEWICKLVRVTPPIFRRRADWYRENRGFSIEKAKRELGYKPEITLEEGLKRTGQWYQEHGYI